MRRFLFLLALAIPGALLFRSFLFEGIYLKTDSMAPTLPEGTHVMVNKFVLKFNKVQRGDIVMFHTPQQPDRDKDLVKRVIAIEGDIFEIKNKKMILNGRSLDEPYVQILHPDILFQGDNIPPILVPKGHVVVMGDNRDVSRDSRDWRAPSGRWSPYVSVDSIKGRVIVPN